MQLCKIVGKQLIHSMVFLPSIDNKHTIVTGRKGLACSTNPNKIFRINEFEGDRKDITCKKCLALTS